MPSNFVYDYIIGYLCATSYLPVKSVEVSCVSACVSSIIHLFASVCLIFHIN